MGLQLSMLAKQNRGRGRYRNRHRKGALSDRIVTILMKIRQRGYAVHEDPAEYATGLDPDTNFDPDADGEHEQTDRQQTAGGYRRQPAKKRDSYTAICAVMFDRRIWNRRLRNR
jgi:hypothetical protein